MPTRACLDLHNFVLCFQLFISIPQSIYCYFVVYFVICLGHSLFIFFSCGLGNCNNRKSNNNTISASSPGHSRSHLLALLSCGNLETRCAFRCRLSEISHQKLCVCFFFWFFSSFFFWFYYFSFLFLSLLSSLESHHK